MVGSRLREYTMYGLPVLGILAELRSGDKLDFTRIC